MVVGDEVKDIIALKLVAKTLTFILSEAGSH